MTQLSGNTAPPCLMGTRIVSEELKGTDDGVETSADG